MAFEHQLITKLCDGADWRAVKDTTGPEHFTQVDAAAAWRFGIRHAGLHGAWPSRDVLRDQLPRFAFEASTDAPTALAERLHAAHVYRLIAENTDKVMGAAVADPLEAGRLLVEAGAELRTVMNRATGKTGINIAQADQVAAEREAYRVRAEVKGLMGLSWPWPILDERTRGLQDSQLVVFYARPKSGKSFYLQYLAEHFHFRYKVPTILFTREMSPEQLRGRHVATAAKLDYTRYMRGQLTERELRALDDTLDLLPELPPYVIETVAGSGEAAADEMIAKAQDVGARLLAVDGIYFFGNRDWEQIALFSSRLKWHLLNTYRIPGLATTQGARAKRAGGDDVAYGDSIFQDADILIKMRWDGELHDHVAMSTAGLRDGRPASWTSWFRPCSDFSLATSKGDEADETVEPGVEVTA